MNLPAHYVIYTDLDGTLLDHHSYSHNPALPALKQAKSVDAPVIPVTSKTRAELTKLREAIGLDGPFIVENGAAIYIPNTTPLAALAQENGYQLIGDYWVDALSMTRAQWTDVIDELSKALPTSFVSFSQMSAAELSGHTGLTEQEAVLANQRDYSDPLHWTGTDADFAQLSHACRLKGIEVVKGGRFVHLIKGADKGLAVERLHRLYRNYWPERQLKSMVLGDGGNDVSMLEKADQPVCIRSPNGGYPSVINRSAYFTKAEGPAGWCEAVQMFLQYP